MSLGAVQSRRVMSAPAGTRTPLDAPRCTPKNARGGLGRRRREPSAFHWPTTESILEDPHARYDAVNSSECRRHFNPNSKIPPPKSHFHINTAINCTPLKVYNERDE